MEGAGTDFEVERLDQHAALFGPVFVEALDELLERRWLELRCGHGGEHGGKAG